VLLIGLSLLAVVISDEYETFPDTVASGDNMDEFVEDQVSAHLPELAARVATAVRPEPDVLRERDVPAGIPTAQGALVSAGAMGSSDLNMPGCAVGLAESRGLSSSLGGEIRQDMRHEQEVVQREAGRDMQRERERESTYSSLHREVVKGAVGEDLSSDDEDCEGLDVEAFQVRNNQHPSRARARENLPHDQGHQTDQSHAICTRQSQSDFDLEAPENTPVAHAETRHGKGAAGKTVSIAPHSSIAPEAAFLPPSWQEEEEEPPGQHVSRDGTHVGPEGLTDEYDSGDVHATLKDLGFDDSLSLSMKASQGKMPGKQKVGAVDMLDDFIDF